MTFAMPAQTAHPGHDPGAAGLHQPDDSKQVEKGRPPRFFRDLRHFAFCSSDAIAVDLADPGTITSASN